MKIILFLMPLIGLVSCTNNIGINVMHPAEIAIPADLDSVLIVDRSKMSKGSGKQIGNVLEGILTGEPIAGDKYGRKGCLENLEFMIASNDRLSIVHREVIVLENPNGNFDNKEPLKANFLDSVCKKYGADGVIALEHFDSDRALNSNGYPVGEAYVTTRWRLYYPNTKSIIDEHGFQTYGQGYQTSIIDFPTQYKAIYNAGAQASDWYIKRIVPSWYAESRMYYVSGSKEMKIAKKQVQVENWGEAKFMWEAVINDTSNPKLLGKATYNLAVANEMEGNLEMAISWANKSARTGNKYAPKYANILKRLQNEQPLIEDQLKHE
jgi:hypothetical protein